MCIAYVSGLIKLAIPTLVGSVVRLTTTSTSLIHFVFVTADSRSGQKMEQRVA